MFNVDPDDNLIPVLLRKSHSWHRWPQPAVATICRLMESLQTQNKVNRKQPRWCLYVNKLATVKKQQKMRNVFSTVSYNIHDIWYVDVRGDAVQMLKTFIKCDNVARLCMWGANAMQLLWKELQNFTKILFYNITPERNVINKHRDITDYRQYLIVMDLL